MRDALDRIIETFRDKGGQKYADEEVTQLQHAIQTAELAAESGSEPSLVAAALLHDIGHLLEAEDLPASRDEDLDDGHENIAYPWLLEHFGPAVADPVRLHVPAKRYLCTRDPSYETTLSPTSLKSYHDQGGRMSDAELAQFESEPHFDAALRLRRWDDEAKDPNRTTPPIDAFLPQLEACLLAHRGETS